MSCYLRVVLYPSDKYFSLFIRLPRSFGFQFLCFEDLVGRPITELGHFDVFDTETLGLMRSPFYSDLVVQVVPGRVMPLRFAFIGDNGHEAPCCGEAWKSELTDKARF